MQKLVFLTGENSIQNGYWSWGPCDLFDLKASLLINTPLFSTPTLNTLSQPIPTTPCYIRQHRFREMPGERVYLMRKKKNIITLSNISKSKGFPSYHLIFLTSACMGKSGTLYFLIPGVGRGTRVVSLCIAFNGLQYQFCK